MNVSSQLFQLLSTENVEDPSKRDNKVEKSKIGKVFLYRACYIEATDAVMLPMQEKTSINAGMTTASIFTHVRRVRNRGNSNMSIISEERGSDSPYVETIIHGRTESNGSPLRPAEICWHMVLRKLNGTTDLLVVGPWTSAGVISYPEGAELLWIKFKLGAFLPHLPTKHLLDKETVLPAATGKSFWLNGSAWQFPDYENADTFVDRLVRANMLAYDPVVNAVVQNQLKDMPSRTVRHRFKHATGLTQSHIRQMKRAQHAQALLQQGVSILDTVDEAGYFDQPHLTRSLKQFIGYTPAHIIRLSQPEAFAI